jgi:hypothetical protein
MMLPMFVVELNSVALAERLLRGRVALDDLSTWFISSDRVRV